MQVCEIFCLLRSSACICMSFFKRKCVSNSMFNSHSHVLKCMCSMAHLQSTILAKTLSHTARKLTTERWGFVCLSLVIYGCSTTLSSLKMNVWSIEGLFTWLSRCTNFKLIHLIRFGVYFCFTSSKAHSPRYTSACKSAQVYALISTEPRV